MKIKTPKPKKPQAAIRHYFVDEGGDSTLFSGKGKVIIDTNGCTRFFIMGLLDVPDPIVLKATFDNLRSKLRNDRRFATVPSMQPDRKKTAVLFHAKDDLPDVRDEVFEALKNTAGLRYFAVVTDKRRVLSAVEYRSQRDLNYRYNPNELYDGLVSRLFKDRLHQDKSYEIMFSKRGRSDRTVALRNALNKARGRFAKKWGILSDAPIHVTANIPQYSAGLQAVDYFTWALQRLYERGEDRHLSALKSQFSLVHDIDDISIAKYGVYYTQRNQLSAGAISLRKIKNQ